MTALGLLGAGGRMGRAIAAVAEEMGATLAGGVGRNGALFGAHADAAALAAAADVLIDFSTPDALDAHLRAAVAARTPILIGTTGLDAAHHAAIAEAATRIPVLDTANTSLGVTVLRALVAQAARMLDESWDIEIVEMHHRHKKDAPSGTALLLGRAAAEGRGAAPGALDRTDRMLAGASPRASGTIHYAALRGGSVAGDHQVVFAGEGERVEIGHRAEGRAIFARGAVKGAVWLAAQDRPGRYAMTDVLGLA